MLYSVKCYFEQTMTKNSVKLRDKLDRGLRSLRLSVVDRCNFRCSYCMPEDIFGHNYTFLKKEDWLTFQEMERIVEIFTRLGVTRLRITGGEPLLRPHLSELMSKFAQKSELTDLALTTNGSRLHSQSQSLYDAGLRRITLSLDSLDEKTLQKISGNKASLPSIIKGLDKALEVGFEIKVNTVIMKGYNEDQILPLVKFCRERSIKLRFIEFMDVGNFNDWDRSQVVTSQFIKSMVEKEFAIESMDPEFIGEVAERFRYCDKSDLEIGFISSVTQPFCRSCNRVRLSSDGKIFTCLFSQQGTDIKSLLRSGASDEELEKFIAQVWLVRDDRYSEQRSKERNSPQDSKVEMSYIGG